MENLKLKSVIEDAYGIEVKSIEKIKGVYRVNGETGYGLKVIRYKYSHFSFIISAINHLNQNGFENTPKIIKTKEGREFINIDNKFCYLTKWIVGARQSDFNDISRLKDIGEAVGNLHKHSNGFVIPSNSTPRIGWMSWCEVFKTRRNEIFDFKNRIAQKAYKNNFDKLFLESFEDEVKRAEKTIRSLEESKYKDVMRNDVMKMGFCHHDLANHNILIDENEKINFIDFDYCILDSRLHDLASLLWRVNKFDLYDKRKTEEILKGYMNTNSLTMDDVEVMKNFLSFPNEFWQIGLQVYWEQQPWGEEFMLKKLKKYLGRREIKGKVIENIKI